MSISQPLIKLKNIKKQYQPNTPFVLKGIDLEIFKQDFVALMGSSGSGKTTLMNIIGLLDNPSEGTYYFEGEDISSFSDNELSALRSRKVGFVFQSFYLIPYLTVLDNVLLPRFYSGGNVQDANQRAIDLLTKFGMGERLYSKPSQLSGGQQQRVAIARAMINEPDLILADEPTGQLDSSTSKVIMDYIQSLPDLGCTVLLVTHDKDTAQYAKKTIIMKDGLIVQ